MKAFVIKNKGLYKTTNSRLWTKDISKCAKWDTFAKANQYLKGCYLNNMEDCEVIEITITENNLEQENKRLKEQLSEKNKEIERLKYLLLDRENKSTFFEQLYNQTIEDAKIVKDCGSFTALNKIIRKQACDEIREKIKTRTEAYPIICEDENKVVKRCIFIDTIKDIIKQIEQGEQQ